MAILLRGRKYHYRFRQDGKNYSGACLGCEVPPDASPKIIASIEKKALEYEAAVRERARETSEEIKSEEENIRKNKTVRALLENYRFELSGGRPIPLADAYPLAAAKPSKRQSLSRYSGQRRQYWNDFAAFMEATFPDVADLASVRVPIHPQLQAHLSTLPRENDYVLGCFSYNRRSGAFSTAFGKLLDSLDIRSTPGEIVNFNCFRDSFVTRCDAAGIPRYAVRGVVGHVSDDTTDLYSHDLQTARLIQHLPPAKLEKPD